MPQTISLSCTWSGAAGQNSVACSWTGTAGTGFSRYLVLRGQVGATRGRVLTSSSDPSGGSFSDGALPLGSFSYVVVAMDAADHTLGHSNPVFVDIPAAPPAPDSTPVTSPSSTSEPGPTEPSAVPSA